MQSQIDQFLRDLENKAKAAESMGETMAIDPALLIRLVQGVRGRSGALELLENDRRKPGYFEFQHHLYMIDFDSRFKGPFLSVEEAKQKLGISQKEIDQAFADRDSAMAE